MLPPGEGGPGTVGQLHKWRPPHATSGRGRSRHSVTAPYIENNPCYLWDRKYRLQCDSATNGDHPMLLQEREGQVQWDSSTNGDHPMLPPGKGGPGTV